MCHAFTLQRKYALVAYRETFKRGGRHDYLTGSSHPAVEEGSLSAAHTPRVVGHRTGRHRFDSLPDGLHAPRSRRHGKPVVVDRGIGIHRLYYGASGTAGGVVGSLALGSGEHSLLVWFAQVPPAIFFAVLFKLFQEGNPWPRVAFGVLFWALIAFSIIFLRSQERSSS